MGLFLLVGGLMGYLKGKSTLSLALGLILGLPLSVASLRSDGDRVALVASFLATGFFGYRFYQTQNMFPAGYGAIAGIVTSLLNCVVYPRAVKND